MKARRKITSISLAIVVLMIVSANVSFSQDEYDDMYFNPKDRKEVKFNEEALKSSNTVKSYDDKTMAKNTSASDVINPAYSPGEYGNLEESYSAKNVNPEYIARYKNNPKDSEGMGEVAEGDSYYDDYYDRAVMPGETGQDTDQKKYANPGSYYGGANAMARTRMYGNPMYDPFMGGGLSPGFSFGLGYSMGFMPGMSMSLGYGTGMGYGGYSPYGFYDPFSPFGNPYYSMSRFYNPYYSPWAYDPYNSMMGYGYGGPGYYCPYPSYGYGYSGYGSGMNMASIGVISTGAKVSNSNAIPASNSYESSSYRNRVARGSDGSTEVNTDASNTRTSTRRSASGESQSVANARIASDRDFSQSQNEYYNRRGSRNATSTVSNRTTSRSAVTSTGSTSRSSLNNSSTARVRSSRTNSDYSRPSYKSSREQRSLSSSNGRSRSNSGSSGGNYSSSPRSSGSSFSGSRSSGSSSSFSSGSSSGGSRSSGSSGSSSRSGRGN